MGRTLLAWVFWILWLPLSLLSGLEARALDVPPRSPSGVVDLAGALSGEERVGLSHRLQELESRRAVTFHVLLLSTLAEPGQDGVVKEDLFSWSQKVFDSWKLGGGSSAGVQRDRGLLLVLVLQDRKARFHTGYGLEADLPDGFLRRVIAQDLAPRLREQRIYEALLTATDSIENRLEKSGQPLDSSEGGVSDPDSRRAAPFQLFIILIALLSIWSLDRRRKQGFSVRRGGTFWGGPFGGGGWGDGSGWGSGGGGSSGGFGGMSGGGGASGDW